MVKQHPESEAVHPGGRLRAAGVARLVCCIGIVAGLTESAILAYYRRMGDPLFIDPRTLWLSPIADVVVLGVVAFAVSAAGRVWPRLASVRMYALILGFVALCSVLLLFTSLANATIALLAAGLSFQASRWRGWVTLAVRPFGRRAATVLVAAVLAHMLANEGPRWLGQHERRSALATASNSRPNVLVIVLDTVRASSLSLYGYRRDTTPELKRFARNGVTFDQAISPSPWTLPTHAIMFTGRVHRELSVSWVRALDATYPTLAGFLSSQGYATAGFVANTEYVSAEFGLDRGFLHYEDYVLSPASVLSASSLVRYVKKSQRVRALTGEPDVPGRKRADRINRDFLEWLSSATDRPFFAFLNYYDAHDPYLPPAPFDTSFSSTPARGYLTGPEYGPDDIRRLVDAYDSSLRYLDHEVGSLLKELDRRGTLEDTLVVVTSDHGEEFGEHRLVGHGNSLYIESLHVPLVFVLPARIPAGVRVPQIVGLRHLPATIVELLGLQGSSPFPGSSLVSFWRDPSQGDTPAAVSDVMQTSAQPAWYPAMRGALTSVVIDGRHYIRNWGDGKEEMYDLNRDRAERENLVARPGVGELLEDVRRLVMRRPSPAHTD